MKKILVLLIVLISALTIFGQTTKGKFVLSGGTNLQFSSSNSELAYSVYPTTKSKESSISFLPTMSYFVMDNLAIGLTGKFSIDTEETLHSYKLITRTISIIPMAMYYFPVEGKIRPFLQIGAGYSYIPRKYIPAGGGTEHDLQKGFTYNFGGGIAYFIAENISIDFGVSYTKINLKNDDNNKEESRQGSLGGNIGISIFL